MFKKLKEKLADEVKQNPRLQTSLASVNNLTSQAYSAFNRETSGSRESLSSLQSGTSQASTLAADDKVRENNGSNSEISDLVSFDSPAGVVGSSASSGQFFSLGEDDDPVNLSLEGNKSKAAGLGFQPVDLGTISGDNLSSPPNMSSRGRRLSNSSTSADAGLFPIYEDPPDSMPMFSDLESMAGSEAGWGEDSSAQLSAITKEQMYGMLGKMRARYHKYKGRYTDLARAYKDLEVENGKIKQVMQTTQDRALRRISELREQGTLEKQAKMHLEEELRAEIEEKQHVIHTLNTKVSLLKECVESAKTDSSLNGETHLVDVSMDSGKETLLEEEEVPADNSIQIKSEAKNNGLDNTSSDAKSDESDKEEKVKDSEKVNPLEDKVKRLESLLSKCKENIKANKHKMTALTEVKEKLAVQLEDKEKELQEEKSSADGVRQELESIRNREEGDEIQMAEAKLAMHREMIQKDEEIGELRVTVIKMTEEKEAREVEVEELKKEIKEMGLAQESMEKRLEEERTSAMQELSRGKEAALEQERGRLEQEHKRELARELGMLKEEHEKKLAEVDEEGRLGREELELRLSALTTAEDNRGGILKNLEVTVEKLQSEKKVLEEEAKVYEKNQADINKQKEELNKKLKECEGMDLKMQEIKAEKIIDTEQKKNLQVEVDKKTKALEINNAKMKELADKVKSLECDKICEETKCKEKDDSVKKEQIESKVKMDESIAKMEEETRELREKLEVAESQLKELNEQHKKKLETIQQQMTTHGESHGDLLNEYKVKLETKEKEMELITERVKTFEGKEKEMEILAERVKTLEGDCDDYENRLKYNLESSMITEEELENKIKELEQNLKELDDTLLTKVDELRDANEQVEDFKITMEKMQHFELKSKELEDTLQNKLIELRDANDEIEELKNVLDEKSNNNSSAELQKELDQLIQQLRESNEELQVLKNLLEEKEQSTSDLQKELNSLKEQVKSRQALEQQMISYEKELQNRVSALETEKTDTAKQLEKAREEVVKKDAENENIRKNNLLEVEKLRQDLEMKMRVERERENSHKEFQNQSIDYGKKLQEQMEGKNKIIDKLKADIDNHSKTFNSCNEAYQRETENQSSKIEALSASFAEKDQEFKNLSETVTHMSELLEQKDKEYRELQNEKEKFRESKEENDSKIKEKISNLAEEIGKLTELNESLQSECNESKLNIENVTIEKNNSSKEVQKVLDESDVIKEELKKVAKERDLISVDKDTIESSLKACKEKLEQVVLENEAVKKQVEEQADLAKQLAQANGEIKIAGEEIDNLKIKLRQVEELSHITELKEENAMLAERLSQMEEKEGGEGNQWREEREGLLKEIERFRNGQQNLEKKLKALQQEPHKANPIINNETDILRRLQTLSREWEQKLEAEVSKQEEDIERLQEMHEEELNRSRKVQKDTLERISQDLKDKNDRLERLEKNSEAALQAAKDEARAELDARSNEHKATLAEMQTSHQTKLNQMQEELSKKSVGFDWDENHDSTEDLCGDSPAIFGVPNHTPHPANNVSSYSQYNHSPVSNTHSLEDSPEFEYMKNILYQYMLGQQPLILSKVLSTIAKFSDEQVNEITKHETRKQSYLKTLGLS